MNFNCTIWQRGHVRTSSVYVDEQPCGAERRPKKKRERWPKKRELSVPSVKNSSPQV